MTNKGYLDPVTGKEIVPVSVRRFVFPKILDLNNAKPIAEVAGNMPRWMNLKDHTDLDGQRIAIFAVEIVPGSGDYPDKETGEVRDYVRIACALLDDGGNEPVVIYTGSQNVVERAMAIMGSLSPDTPIIATLQAAGRAWLLV